MSENEKEAPEENVEKSAENTKKRNYKSKKFVSIFASVLIILLLIPTIFLAYAYMVSPESIRNPSFDHYHFRMQVVVDGKVENFGEKKYQQEYSKDLCTADLTNNPIHFHDNKDQFTHIHWNGMTGGLVMKEYGWNFIGGNGSNLGYRMDKLPKPEAVPIKGKLLPAIPDGSNYYVYIGDQNGYVEKSFDDWKNQDLEEFFGKHSNLPGNPGVQSEFLERLLFPSASAHGGVDDGHPDGDVSEADLTRINNLIGNVVIFVQKDKPSDAQIKERFAHLEPLGTSTCGG